MRIRSMSGYRRPSRTGLRVAVVASVAATLAGCESFLEVDVPGILPGDVVEMPENADGLMAAVVGTFECAFVRAINAGGYVSNELADATAGNFTFAGMIRRDPDRSSLPTSTNTCEDTFGLYTPISQARWTADNFIGLLNGWTDAQVANRAALLARANAYSGYGHILLGELYCSAAFDGGPQVTPFEVFTRAEQRFTDAITYGTAANLPSVVNMALVGRARVRNNMGLTAGALADAQAVPINFRFNAQYSDQGTRTRNTMHTLNYAGNTFTINVPYRGLTFDGVADPRVPVQNTGLRGGDNTTPLWRQTKYNSPASPIAIAKWEEAQLIIAEIQGGATAVGIINTLHTRVGLPATFASADPATIRAQVIQERQRELFLESQALYDMIRFNTPLYPPPGTVFRPPSSTFFGDQLCQPLPTVETDNNENIDDDDVIWDVIRS